MNIGLSVRGFRICGLGFRVSGVGSKPKPQQKRKSDECETAGKGTPPLRPKFSKSAIFRFLAEVRRGEA